MSVPRTSSLYLASLAAVLGVVVGACSGPSSCRGRKAPPAGAGLLTPGAKIDTPAHAAYVTNNGSDAISVIDRDGEAVTTVPVDLEPDAHEAPHHLAIDPARRALFVALAFPPAAGAKKDPHATHGAGSEAGRVARLDLGTLAVHETTPVDENPGDVILSHDRRRLLVTHFDMKRAMDVAARGAASPATMFAHLIVLDATTMKRVGSRAVCTAPHGIATTGDDRTAFIACYGSDELAIVDLAAEGLPTTRIPLGAAPGVPGVPRYGPYSATLSPDEAHVIVADLEGQDVRVFDRATKRFLPERTVHLAAKAFMPAFLDAHTLVVPTQAPDGLARIDLETAQATVRSAPGKAVCALPHAVRVAKDGRVYVVCEGDHVGPGAIVEIDPATLAVKRRWQVGVYPDGLELAE